MAASANEHRAFRSFDLTVGRVDNRPRRDPAPHQVEALESLNKWFDGRKAGPRGGIVVLPTGGGKTFTAIRFLCTEPLSKGFKVLWLAHTHHLLEQAADAFGRPGTTSADEAAWVAEPKSELDVRVVSGTIGHCRINEIRASDDVVVCTLPSAARALSEGHSAFDSFLEAAGDKLAVVFDEAHHAPAPTYSRLIEDIRKRCPKMVLLGLTATPTYGEKGKSGWLKRLFPQEILYQVSSSRLMAAGILSRPHLEQVQTRIQATFTEREYAKWISTYQDLPETIITSLAENRARNDVIVATYVNEKKRYGRTIIFADRWYQCDYLREALRKHNVRADVVYSHVTTDKSGVEQRAKRTADDNGNVLQAFRDGALDVLINVRMLTEGTDVPNVQSVFLTRQTTSQVLLTQMIGRALRGPKFGGTENAFIVSFADDWTVPISWADPIARLEDGGTETSARDRARRAPVQLLSIELVRSLARELSSASGLPQGTFLSHIPTGWYRTTYDVQVANSEDIECAQQLVLVFDADTDGFSKFIAHLLRAGRKESAEILRRVDLQFGDVQLQLAEWAEKFISEGVHDESRLTSLLHIARHIAQTGAAPPFFQFEARSEHDLDAVARQCIAANLGPLHLRQSLRTEFDRADRFWTSLYPTFELFERHYAGMQNRVLTEMEHGGTLPKALTNGSVRTNPPAPTEPSADIKRAVHNRDFNQCQCCGSKRHLEVDHIAPSYLGGAHTLDNLQTLCRTCNSDKRISELNFLRHSTPLHERPQFALLPIPKAIDARSVEHWEQYIRRTINFFYRCSAVQVVEIKLRGQGAGSWTVWLYPDLKLKWMLTSSLTLLRETIAERRGDERLFGPSELRIEDL